MVCTATQSTYDPNSIKSLIPGSAYLESALQELFGVTPEEFDSPSAMKLFADASAMTHVSDTAPPVHLGYTTPRLPFDETLNRGAGIHHPRFGEILKAEMVRVGRECVLVYREDLPALSEIEAENALYEMDVRFLIKQFRL